MMTSAEPTWHRFDSDGVSYRTSHRPPVHLITPPCTPRDVANVTDEQWRDLLCVHEAGHFVVGRQLGLPAVWAEVVVSRNDHRAVVSFDPWREGTAWRDVAVMAAAGEQAVLRWLHESGLYTPARGWVAEMTGMGDRTSVQEASLTPLSVHTDDPTAEHDWRYLCTAARRRLAVCWPEVTEVAAALATSGRITATTFDDRPDHCGVAS